MTLSQAEQKIRSAAYERREKVARTERARKVKARQSALLLGAAALEDRAASLTRTIAALDEERMRILIRAAVMRQEVG